MSLDLQSLETSFDLVAPRGDELMDVFYARLFAAAPAVRPLFAGTDMRRQKGMLLGALVLLRKSLRDLDRIVPALREMGARHVRYGARPEHYPVVGEVLIASMAEIAGDDWRDEYAAAWAAAYGIVAATMIEGAASAPARRPRAARPRTPAWRSPPRTPSRGPERTSAPRGPCGRAQHARRAAAGRDREPHGPERVPSGRPVGARARALARAARSTGRQPARSARSPTTAVTRRRADGAACPYLAVAGRARARRPDVRRARGEAVRPCRRPVGSEAAVLAPPPARPCRPSEWRRNGGALRPAAPLEVRRGVGQRALGQHARQMALVVGGGVEVRRGIGALGGLLGGRGDRVRHRAAARAAPARPRSPAAAPSSCA